MASHPRTAKGTIVGTMRAIFYNLISRHKILRLYSLVLASVKGEVRFIVDQRGSFQLVDSILRLEVNILMAAKKYEGK